MVSSDGRAKKSSCNAGKPVASIGPGPTAPTNKDGEATMTTQPTPKGAWRITFLLFLFMLVNFADKIVVGLAGVPIMTELKLEPSQFGLLGSSFFFLFSISAIVVGFIVNRVATRWVLIVLAVVWALAQFPMVGTIGFTTLLICRVILGAGEGPAFSVAAHSVYKWFPDEKRTLAHRDPVAGLGVRRDPGGAGAELGDRQLYLALCLWRARRGRIVVGAGVADLGQGRAAGPDRRDGRGRTAHSLFAAFDVAHLHRLLRGNVRGLLGACRWASPGSRPLSSRASAFRRAMRAGYRSCPGCSAPRSCCSRGGFRRS